LAAHTPPNKWRPRNKNRIRPVVKAVALTSIPVVFSLLVAFYAIRESRSIPTEETTTTAESAPIRPEHTSADLSPDSIDLLDRESLEPDPPIQVASLAGPASLSSEPKHIPEEPAATVERSSKSHPAEGLREPLPDPNSSAPNFYPYSLKLGSFRTRAQIEKAAAFYRQMGLSPFWVKITLKDSGVWYRLFAGCFSDLAKAEEFRQEYGLTKALIKKTKYANLLGTYTSSRELGEKVLALEGQGFSPYVIVRSDGTSQVYVGAFLTLSGAETQKEDLSSAQFENRIVKR
jgi:cell division protein FtsN